MSSFLLPVFLCITLATLALLLLQKNGGLLNGTRACRIKTEFDVKMDLYRKMRDKEKEKSDRKKALSSMSKEKKKKSEETSERKKKVRLCCMCRVQGVPTRLV